MFIEIKSMYRVKESKDNDPYINKIIREYNNNLGSSSSRSSYNFGSVGHNGPSCNSGSKGWSYDPYTYQNCNINTLYNSR